jgi:hypothetical protein
MVYGLRRRPKSHGQLARNELNESFDHLKQAAAHAAQGVGSSVGPRVVAASGYMTPQRIRGAAVQGWGSTVAALAPVAAAARTGARQGQRVQARQIRKLRREMEMSRRRRRWPLISLLAAGAAAGAAGAAVMRRRRQQQWDEYEPGRAMESMSGEARSMVDSAKSSFDRGVDRTAGATEGAVESAQTGVDKVAGRTTSAVDSAAEAAKRQSERTAETADDLITRSGSPSRNNRT